jgi:DNA-binding IclR family transcriptional regulator
MASIALQLIDSKIVAVLRTLFSSKEPFYLRECAQKANIPVTTTLRILENLASLHIVTIQQIKHLKLYSVADTEENRSLASLLRVRKK